MQKQAPVTQQWSEERKEAYLTEFKSRLAKIDTAINDLADWEDAQNYPGVGGKTLISIYMAGSLIAAGLPGMQKDAKDVIMNLLEMLSTMTSERVMQIGHEKDSI